MSLEISGTLADGTNISLVKQTDKFGLVNLTELWQDFGAIEGREPAAWYRTKAGQGVLTKLGAKFKVVNSQLWKSKAGRHGATYGHHLLAWAYLSWISPDVMLFMCEAAQEKAEAITAGLSVTRQRTVKRLRNLGKDDEAIKSRLNGQDTRIGWSGEMSSKGIRRPMEYAICSNGLYDGLWGGKAADLKERLGLPKSASLRDHLDNTRLIDLEFAESLATRMSQQTLDAGLKNMEALNRTTGQMVSRTIGDAMAVALNGGHN
jgi:KilA-N domain